MRLSAAVCVAMSVVSAAASAQNYPARPIRMLVGEVGGSSDVPARLIAQGIADPLGKPVIVENRPSNLIGELAARATPDGYTLIGSGNLLWLEPLIKRTGYDMDKDFAPITLVTATPQVVVVHPSVPAKSVSELIAYAKANPGKLNYASGPTGAPSHLAPELFNSMAGINIVRVNYRGSGPGLAALIAGEAQMMVNNATAAMPHVKAGRIRALAVTTARPSPLLPGLPTVAESGLPGYETVNMFGILAPAKTPAAAIKLLNREIVTLLRTQAVREKLENLGAEVGATSPQEFGAQIRSETGRMHKMIKATGISAD